MKDLIILGISGNIGEQTLSLLKNNKIYRLIAFSVGDKVKKIPLILKEHKSVKAIYLKKKDETLFKKYPKIKFYYGSTGLVSLINEHHSDLIVNALVGFVGLEPTLVALKNGIDVALANKESLVCGGDLVKKALKRSKAHIIPIDSEHSAIYKCFKSVKHSKVKEIILTASGGALRDYSYDELDSVSQKEALNHPNWKMGKKVTIDSSNMLNKGFEIIEAHYLFNFKIKNIKILMHKESHVHSIVKLKDNTYLGEVNKPSMLNPISYALFDQESSKDVKHVKDLKEFGPYHFSSFNKDRYPLVSYALKAIKMKGIMPTVLNAVDEVVVDLFLKNMISYLDIDKIIARSFKVFRNKKHPSLNTLKRADKEAREWAKTAALIEGSL